MTEAALGPEEKTRIFWLEDAESIWEVLILLSTGQVHIDQLGVSLK